MNNGILFQAFEWELPADGTLFQYLTVEAHRLADIGITAVWLPPVSKGNGGVDVGYTAYDLWDLGEYDQHGSVRTKYGTKQQLHRCIDALHQQGIKVYADVVYNHKGKADFTEAFQAVKVDPDDRNKALSEPYDIEGWTGFNFPGRAGKRSDFEWHFWHFSGVDYDQQTGENGIFRIVGEHKSWNDDTDIEKGNYDYLMNADIDHDHPEVREELMRFSTFLIEEMAFDGFRYDALKHISLGFIKEHTAKLLSRYPDHYFLGEYWKNDLAALEYYINYSDQMIALFDVPLHFNLYTASVDRGYDLRTIFDNTLVYTMPERAVTFVDNHDSQPSQSLDSWIQPWFKEIAYALILLRNRGYPCIFWGDLIGIPAIDYDGIGERLTRMCQIRHSYCYGQLVDYLDSPTLIGWVLMGSDEHSGKLAVLISTGDAAQLTMHVGIDQAGKTYCDLSGRNQDISIDGDGNGVFTVGAGSVTYWSKRQS